MIERSEILLNAPRVDNFDHHSATGHDRHTDRKTDATTNRRTRNTRLKILNLHVTEQKSLHIYMADSLTSETKAVERCHQTYKVLAVFKRQVSQNVTFFLKANAVVNLEQSGRYLLFFSFILEHLNAVWSVRYSDNNNWAIRPLQILKNKSIHKT